MTILAFLWRRIAALASTLLVLVAVLALFLAYRWVSAGQQDNVVHVQEKRQYLAAIASGEPIAADMPNIILVLYDDLGYGDIGAGAEANPLNTPNIDALAAAGVTLSDFYSPAPVCTPSRAGFMTGRLPARAGLPNVIFPSDTWQSFLFNTLATPDSNVRLPEEEITLADVLQAAGYATGMVGKWHMGDRSPSLPNDMGFQQYFGALYSNDMEPFALYRNDRIEVAAPADQDYLTEHYTREATQFIEQHREEPFFLYFAHNFPHDPLHAREDRLGQSAGGLYGDVVEEIDDSIGEIVAALERTDNLENTLLLITSDNGPWFLGSAGDQRGRKGNTFEGGMRVPFIAHWPKGIPAGRTEPAMAMGTDLLPTVLDLLQLPAPTDRQLDGRSILSVLTAGAVTPHDFLYYYDGKKLFAVRDQRFKYRAPAGVMFYTDQAAVGGAMSQKEWLFDLAGDSREAYDTSLKYTEEADRLRKAFANKNHEMSENTRGWR